MHLIIVKYDDDAERKKIEYLMGKYGAKRVKDVVIEVDDSIYDPFVKELFGRIPEEKIRLFSVSEKKVMTERTRKEIRESFNTDVETLTQFVNYLIVRRRGNYRGNLGGFQRYRLYTKKGLADVSLKYTEKEGSTSLWMRIEGGPEVIEMIEEEMKKEFRNYKESLEPIKR